MPLSLAKRLDAVAPSVTLAMSARTNELRNTGVDVIAFGVGEPDFEPPPYVLAAAKAAIDKGASKYTAVTGILPLKQAICEVAKRKKGFKDVTPDLVTVSVGAKHALMNLAIALYEEGDEVIIPAPCWVSYPEQVRMMGAVPVIVPTLEKDGFRLSAAQLEAAITKRTKAILLCTPSNPTGSAYSREALMALCEVVRKHDVWLIVDEIYADLVYDGFKHVSVAEIAPDLIPRLVIVDGVSKTYAMTGWRIGWSITPKPLAKALDVVQGQSTTNPAAVSQYAAIAALTGPQEDVEKMRATFENRRNVMVKALRELPNVRCAMPEGAFYAFPDFSATLGMKWGDKIVKTDEDLAFFLLDRAHVAVVPGGAFHAPGYLRLSYATSEARILEGVARIKKAIEEAAR